MEQDLKKLIFDIKDELIFFHLLDKEDLEQILPFFELLNCPAGTTIFNEGDEGDYVCFIAAGRFEVKKQTEFKGKQIIIALLGKGSIVGEMSLIDQYPRSATVVSREDSQMVILRRDSVDAISQKYPQIGIKILKGLNRILSLRLRQTVDRLIGIF
ncbi:MAG: CarD family transcriptional regulator [Actinobacteria bacterium]|nr:CarD family transcriptional regulator [Actinomycetota bacterium]